jgi:predicted O-linked N-acetylglucosamine transferase (SPINDLY family)
MWRAFEAGGVSRDRVAFIPVRGTHRQHYNAIDIALDTFPQTGGTTTCECLWMGVPVVTLVGPAFFERLSYSNLNNAGLGDLCAFSREAYVDKALALAADLPRRHALRSGLRQQIRQQPLGRADWFVDDFQQAVIGALGRGPAAGPSVAARSGATA